MADLHGQEPKLLGGLKEAFGGEVELVSEDGAGETYRILAEFQLGDSVYAALQSDSMAKEGDAEMFRVVYEGGEPRLETIEDDEEWENAAEAFDDMLFSDDESP